MIDQTIVRYLVGAFIGGIAGYGYYRLVGCRTGMCPITSKPYISVVYGMAMGAMISGQ